MIANEAGKESYPSSDARAVREEAPGEAFAREMYMHTRVLCFAGSFSHQHHSIRSGWAWVSARVVRIVFGLEREMIYSENIAHKNELSLCGMIDFDFFICFEPLPPTTTQCAHRTGGPSAALCAAIEISHLQLDPFFFNLGTPPLLMFRRVPS